MFKGVKKAWQTFVTRGREKVIFDAGGPCIVRVCEQVIWDGSRKKLNESEGRGLGPGVVGRRKVIPHTHHITSNQ